LELPAWFDVPERSTPLADPEYTGALADTILQATVALIEESGLEAVTMRSIAGRIGYSPTTIYLYFKGKEDLLTSALVYAHQQLAQGLLAAQSIDDLRERLRVSATWFVRWGVEHPNTYRLLFEQAPRSRSIGVLAEPAREIWVRNEELIAEAMRLGLIAPGVEPSTYAQLVWGALHGIVWLATTLRFEDTVFPGDGTEASARAASLAESLVALMLGPEPDPSGQTPSPSCPGSGGCSPPA